VALIGQLLAQIIPFILNSFLTLFFEALGLGTGTTPTG